MPYDDSRGYFRDEADFPGPRTMTAAAQWLENDGPHHERFLLFVDEFDPHEPFDTPEPYASMYDESWEGAHLIWPPYMRGAIQHGVLTENDARQLRAQYGAKLTMIDAWFGRILDAMDRAGLWESTALIVTTDHGHYLGEKDVWGKPQVPVYEPLGHIPLLIAWPGIAPGSCDALTTSVDINATLCDLFGITPRQQTHGTSLIPLVTGDTTSAREWAVAGVWGREVHLITDDGTKYARAPAADNAPLSMWSNRWSTMPTLRPGLEIPVPDDRAVLDRMPGSNIPVIRQPFDVSDNVPFWAMGRFSGHHLYAVDDDPTEDNNLAGTPAEKTASDALGDVLRELDAPRDQLVRLGLA
jgi:arylsulfatase A-like enzyme